MAQTEKVMVDAELPQKRFFRPDEVARYLEHVSKRMVYRWCQLGRIHYIRFGRRTVIPREELARLMVEGCPLEEER